MSKESVWAYFDNWYIITLSDTDTKDIEKNLKRAGVCKYEILRYKSANKRDNAPINASLCDLLMHTTCDETGVNIFENHISTIKKAYGDKKNRNIVILEDDARFELPIDKNKIVRVSKWLKKNYWELFFFGHCPWPIPISVFHTVDIVQPYNALLGHCYVLTRVGMYKILKSVESVGYSRVFTRAPSQIDFFLSNTDLYKYALYPSISYQNKSPAIYRKISEKIGICLPYNKIFFIFESIAVILPVIILIIILYIIYKIIKR
jgi:hypothetical protein